MDKKFTAKDVAEFMKTQLDRMGCIYQEDIAYSIQEDFGEEFIYFNDNGGVSIDRKVLSEFRKLTPDVVWERGERCWRPRIDEYDAPDSRMQD